MKHVILFICLMTTGLNFSYAQEERSEDAPHISTPKRTVEKWSVQGDEVEALLQELGIEQDVELEFDDDDEIEIIRIEKNRVRSEHPMRFFLGGDDFELNMDEFELDMEDFEFDMEDFELNMDELKEIQKFKFKYSDEEGEQDFEWEGDGEMPEEMRKAIEQLHERMEMGHPDFNFEFDHKGPHHQRPLLGVYTGKVDDGVVINDVIVKSGAELAGLKKGDVLLKVDGEAIPSTSSLIDAIQKHEVGDKVTVTFERDDKVQSLEATLGASDHGKEIRRVERHRRPNQRRGSCMAPNAKPRLGVQFLRTSEGPQNDLVIDKVMEGSTAEDAGLKTGDQIISFNQTRIADHKSLIEALNKVNKGEQFSIKVLRDGVEKTLTAEMKSEKQAPFMVKKFRHAMGKNMFDGREDQSEEDVIIIRKKRSNNLSVEQAPEKELNLAIYPNPTQGSIRLSFEGDQLPTEIKIYDAQGKEYYNQTITPQNGKIDQVIELDGNPSGAIFLSLKNGDEIMSEKIILQK